MPEQKAGHWQSAPGLHRQGLIKWLRSGKFKQGRMRLRTQDNEYCCLGIACEYYGADGWHETELGWEYKTDDESEPICLRASMPKAVTDYFGFFDSLGSFVMAAGGHMLELRDRANKVVNAAALNDEGFSFEQIADMIEYFWGIA